MDARPAAWAAAMLVGLSATASLGAGASSYQVENDGIPASLTGAQGDPARGRRVIADRQVGTCLLCHSGPFPEERFQGSVGPDLAGVGARLSEAQIRLRVIDSSLANPKTIMPPYFVKEGLTRVAKAWQGRTALSAEQVEDIVALLITLREP